MNLNLVGSPWLDFTFVTPCAEEAVIEDNDDNDLCTS